MDCVTNTGKNFSIIISCQNNCFHHQMAFASWYSITKNLPDSNVEIAVQRSLEKFQLFGWARKCGIKFYFHNKELEKPENGVIIPPTVMAIRAFDEKFLGPIDVKSEEQTTFVDCVKGCGKFIEQIGIDKRSNFLERATSKFGVENMTPNETRVLKLWTKAAQLYRML